MIRRPIRIALSVLLLAVVPARAESDRQGVRWGALPIANYTSDQGLTVGALAQRFDYAEGVLPFHSLLTTQVSFAERGPRQLLLSFERTRVGERQWRLRADLTLYDNRAQRYYGLGSRSPRDASALGRYSYHQRQATLELSARRALPGIDGLDLQATLGGQTYASSAAAGSSFGADFGTDVSAFFPYLQVRAILERRDSEFIPSRGVFASAAFRFAPGLGAGQRSWNRFDTDLRHYLPLAPERWLWLASQLRYTATSAGAPLQERARLGSLGTLRGLPLNRYTDTQAVALRTELRSVLLRWRIFDLPLKAGPGLFVDTGRVGNSLAAIASAPTAFSWGFTLFGSYFTDDFLGSADLGFSPDGIQFYFGLGHAF